MTPAQIEGFIDRICGIYPTNNVYRKGMRSTWALDDFLLDVDVDDGRKVLALVEQHGKIPSLPEMKQLFRQMWGGKATPTSITARCEVCNESGWDNGWRTTEVDNFHTIEADFYTEEHMGHTYRVVKPCVCPHGRERAAALRQLQQQ